MDLLDILDPIKNIFGNCDFFINRFFGWSWADCCAAHDEIYIQGGNEQLRELADQVLGQCVAASGAEAPFIIAGIITLLGSWMAWATKKWGKKYWIKK